MHMSCAAVMFAGVLSIDSTNAKYKSISPIWAVPVCSQTYPRKNGCLGLTVKAEDTLILFIYLDYNPPFPRMGIFHVMVHLA